MAEPSLSTDAESTHPQITHMIVEGSPTKGVSIEALADPDIGGPEPLASQVEISEGALNDESPIATEFEVEGQVVLILCGLIASGKSTFAQSLERHFPNFKRCNQDDLGDRRRVEQLARQTLSQGHSVCIDRTNFDASQRFHWIKIAREFPGTKIWVIVFDVPYETCAARLQKRTGHPTITSPEQGLSVLSRFAGDFVAPGDHEGYDRILNVKLSDCPTTPEYSRTDISVILQRVRDSTPVAATRGFPPYSPSNRGHSRGSPHRGWRGGSSPTMNGNFRGGIQGTGGYVPNSRGSRGWNTSSFRGDNGVGRSRPDRGRGRGVWQPTAGDGQSG